MILLDYKSLLYLLDRGGGVRLVAARLETAAQGGGQGKGSHLRDDRHLSGGERPRPERDLRHARAERLIGRCPADRGRVARRLRA
eukprot:502712-Prorocentrum_minimum.AAC.3